MQVCLTITETDLKKLVIEKIKEKIQGDFDPARVSIRVKSKQNYKAEWEEAEFKAEYNGPIDII